jgi:IS4 transposase
VAATGAHLLWRVPANRVLDVERALPDGSWHSRLYAAGDRPAQRDPVRVRVVAYALDDPGRTGAGEYRLVTDLLDHQRYPANELAALYAQRWEEETALDELKTHSAARAWC